MMLHILLVQPKRNKYGPILKIFKHVQLPYLPVTGMSLEYQDGWALSDVQYVYGTLDGNLEVGLFGLFDGEFETLRETEGWYFEEMTPTWPKKTVEK